jgi:DNA-binding beta-propeller fold protein YncE/mono/diheme cytochrome c family protein
MSTRTRHAGRLLVAIALSAGLLHACGGGGSGGVASPADARQKGQFSAVHDWPLIPIHAVLMPDGRVLTYGSHPDGRSTAYFSLDVWDGSSAPDKGHQTILNGTGNDIFCGTQLLLPPTLMGDAPAVFMAGGDAWDGNRSTFVGITGASVYDAATQSLKAAGTMHQPRWYATAITLTNGETYIQGGFGGANKPEVRQLDGSFRNLSSADTSALQWSYPRNYVMPDGRVFGYDYEGRMYFVDPSGTGSVAYRPILPWQYFGEGSAALFRPGRILQVGGNSNAAAVIDVTSGEPVFTPTQSTSTVRKLQTATLLADGQVLITGGSPVWNELPGANRQAEIWNPVTGQWTLGAEGDRARLYHSMALLLPDATVLLGGGGAPAPIGGPSVGERNVELYTPPYLFNTKGERAPRPSVRSGPNGLELAKTVRVTAQMPTGGKVSRVTLVKTGSVTHGWNFDQRFIELTHTASAVSGSADTYHLDINAPTRGGEATPGYYMLFVFDNQGVPSTAHMLRVGVAAAPDATQAPSLDNPGRQSAKPGQDIRLSTTARDPNSQPLRFSAAGLPPGLGIDPTTGVISGKPTSAGDHDVVLGVSDGTWSSTASFVWEVRAESALQLSLTPTPGASLVNSPAAFAAGATGQGRVEYSWSFGDGSADTAWSTQPTLYKTFDQPGIFSVTLRVRDSSGAQISRSFLQTVYVGTGDRPPTASSPIVIEVPVHGRNRLWVVNPDNDTVSGFDTLTRDKLVELDVGANPRSVAVSSAGQLWVSNKGADSLSIIDTEARQVLRTLPLPRGAQPHGVAMSPTAAQAFVVLEGTGKLLRLDSRSFTQTGQLDIGPDARHVSVSGNGQTVFVTRFITPPLPGEGTATVDTRPTRGAEVLQIDATTLQLTRKITLAHSDRPDAENQGSGVPNYLGPLTISPDNTQAFVPGKQDNIRRGQLRNGAALDFQNTVRAISSRVNLRATGGPSEDLARRIDHDNASLASAVAYDTRGVYLFVALETSREVAVLDAHSGAQIMRFDTGRAPQGLAVSPDGWTLYVQNTLDRSVGVHDLRGLLAQGVADIKTVATLPTVARERLAPSVLLGKQLFHDARDPRLARDRYLSCASCHADGGHDGRVWDFTQQGEGLRNTISLRGRGGVPGRQHWTGNFDEVQDFEDQIRRLAGGTGLMRDTDFRAGTRAQPLGDRKAGLSADLDALAAYVATLNSVPASPWRDASGALTASAQRGRDVYALQCSSCHGGADFGNGRSATLKDIGSLQTSSGKRLGQTLTGLATPGLRGVWTSAPYLHNGSAADLPAAVRAHRNMPLIANMGDADLTSVVDYLRQIDSTEGTAPAARN